MDTEPLAIPYLTCDLPPAPGDRIFMLIDQQALMASVLKPTPRPPSSPRPPRRRGPLALFLLTLAGILATLTGCSNPPPPPDPMTPYYPAFHKESLPQDFDFDATPRYELQVKVDPERRLILGRERVYFRNLSGRLLRDVYVRQYPNLPQLGGLMKLTAVKKLPEGYAVGFAPELENSAARITLIDDLEPNQDLGLEIAFEIVAPQKQGYVLFGDSQGILSLPYAYPMLARQTGDPAHPWRLEIPPVFADIAITDQAFYSVTVTLPDDYLLVTSGVEINQTAAEPGWRAHQFVTGPAREWTMVVSKNLQKISQTVDGNQVNSYFLPRDGAAGKSALAYSAAVLRTYDQIFSPYPYTELDVIEAPTRYLGMEYPKLNYIGMDTYRSVAQTQEYLIAHEISHQWWYALVGSDPYRYPWLDEGLAEHSSLLYMETLYGPAAADRIRTLRWEIPVEWARKNGYDTPVGQEVTAFTGANYELMVYAKSALFFDSLYQAMGREAYLNALQTFIDRYRFKTPTPDDFLAIVEEVGGIDPTPLYEEWIEGSQSPAASP